MSKWIRFKRQDSQLVEFGKLLDDTDLNSQRVNVCTGDMFDQPEATDEILEVGGLQILTPCAPGKFICLWKNVRTVAEKNGLTIPEETLFLFKPSSSFLPHLGEIQRPEYFDGKIIYEGELGIVVGKTCNNVSEQEAEENIFGYTCVNDVTAVSLIDKDPSFAQWSRAKCMDTFGVFGPSISTDVDPVNLRVQTNYLGKIRQDYAISDLIFSPSQIVSMLSRDMTLEPGDLIACGTADGVLPLKPGSTVEVQINGLDTLVNTMAAD